MNRIMVAGCGTGVGKTVVAAILTTLLQGDYWKPIQCGPKATSDTEVMKQLIDARCHRIHPSSYSLKGTLSPHHAARLENRAIELEKIIPPTTTRPLIIEGVGGVFVPLRVDILTIDLFKQWNCLWVIVSKHYLGSINHTLLTIEALKHHNINVAGIIFNGRPHFDSEIAILQNSNIPFLGRLLPERTLNRTTIQRYATQWQRQLLLLTP